MGGSDISIPLSPGSHVDTHPFGEIFLFLVLLLFDFSFWRSSVNMGTLGPGAEYIGGAECMGYGCLGHAANDEALEVRQKK